MRAGRPLRDIAEEQGLSLTQLQYSYQNQELHIGEVHVQVSPTVPILSFGAIFFSAAATPGLGFASGS